MQAAETRDYDALPPLLNDEELAAWRNQGPKPLEIMDAILRMPHEVRKTNEGDAPPVAHFSTAGENVVPTVHKR